MVVDYQRVTLGLKAYVGTKRSFGQDELLREIARLEVESQLPESEHEFDRLPRQITDTRSGGGDDDSALRLEEPKQQAALA